MLALVQLTLLQAPWVLSAVLLPICSAPTVYWCMSLCIARWTLLWWTCAIPVCPFLQPTEMPQLFSQWKVGGKSILLHDLRTQGNWFVSLRNKPHYRLEEEQERETWKHYPVESDGGKGVGPQSSTSKINTLSFSELVFPTLCLASFL